MQHLGKLLDHVRDEIRKDPAHKNPGKRMLPSNIAEKADDAAKYAREKQTKFSECEVGKKIEKIVQILLQIKQDAFDNSSNIGLIQKELQRKIDNTIDILSNVHNEFKDASKAFR